MASKLDRGYGVLTRGGPRAIVVGRHHGWPSSQYAVVVSGRRCRWLSLLLVVVEVCGCHRRWPLSLLAVAIVGRRCCWLSLRFAIVVVIGCRRR